MTAALPQEAENPSAFSPFGSLTLNTGLKKANAIRQRRATTDRPETQTISCGVLSADNSPVSVVKKNCATATELLRLPVPGDCFQLNHDNRQSSAGSIILPP